MMFQLTSYAEWIRMPVIGMYAGAIVQHMCLCFFHLCMWWDSTMLVVRLNSVIHL